jgi:predicted porin
MQKKLIALAIAGLATAPAFAQSNVTIYGVADTTFENVKASGATTANTDDSTRLNRNRVSANSSLLGFKGAEDLGNGLKAIFQFEGGVSSDTGLSSFSARDTFVGLTGGFGTVVLGNITHPIRAMGTKVDFNPGATGIGFVGSMYGEFLGIKTGTDSRASNAIAYVSPSFSGLTGTVAYVAGETRTASTATTAERKPQQWQIAGQYENGPIYAGIGYHEARDPLSSAIFSTGTPESKLKVFRAAGKYTFGFGLSLAGLWDRQKLTEDPITGSSTDARRDAWMLGAGYATGPHNVYLEYAQANKLKGGVCGTAGVCDNTKSKQWTVGYDYSLSKRTMIKTYYSAIRNDSRANYDYYINPVASSTTTAGLSSSGLAAGADPRGFGVGIRHVF